MSINQVIATFFEALEKSPDKEIVVECIETIVSIYRTHKLENICICFNGGKDSVLLLYLSLAALLKYLSEEECISYESLLCKNGNIPESVANEYERCLQLLSIQFIYNPGEFSEILQTIHQITNINIPLKLEIYYEEYMWVWKKLVSEGKMHCCLLGTRKTDPEEHWDIIEEGPKECGNFVQAFPLLWWDYKTVWNVIKYFNIPYCVLYDQGYTSIGRIHDTNPNPHLKKPEMDGYFPGYMLLDGALERAGRIEVNANNEEI